MASATPRPAELKKYELLCRLATGGMAEVYLARAKGLGGFEKVLVIKRILPNLAADSEFVKMFLDEARIAATLQHSNVVQVFDVDQADGSVFFAMEFLHGQDLRSLFDRLAKRGQSLPLEHAISIVLSVCAGLHYAHERVGEGGRPLDIVHRDVSPSNVLVTYDGGVKIIDFGIARATGKLADTQFGIVKGKVGYMSPEQCRCEPLDRRSDVFCIAILLHELVTGQRLYPSDSLESFMGRMLDREQPPVYDRKVPGDLARIISKGLEHDRQRRYQTALEMQLDLQAFAAAQRLSLSPFGLAQFLEKLFRPELDAWKYDQKAGKTLAEHVRSLRTLSGLRVVPAELSPEPEPVVPVEPYVPTTGEEEKVTGPHAPSTSRGFQLPRRWWLAPMAIGVVALGVFLAVAGGGVKPRPSTGTVLPPVTKPPAPSVQAVTPVVATPPEPPPPVTPPPVTPPPAAEPPPARTIVPDVEPGSEPSKVTRPRPERPRVPPRRKKPAVRDAEPDESDLDRVLPR